MPTTNSATPSGGYGVTGVNSSSDAISAAIAPPTSVNPVVSTSRCEKRRTSTPAITPNTVAVTAAGSSASPARNGPYPCTSWKYCDRKNTRPGQAEHRQQVGGDHAGEPRVAEQPDVDQRVGQPQLAADEQRQRRGAEHPGGDDVGTDAVRDAGEALLDRIDHTEHADHGQRHTGQIPRTGLGVAVFGQQHDAADDQNHHHRDVDQEDRAPPEVLEQHAADHGAERRAGGERRRPDADGDAALPLVGEQAPDQRERGRGQRRPRHPEQRAGGDQHLRRSSSRR